MGAVRNILFIMCDQLRWEGSAIDTTSTSAPPIARAMAA
jgi:hypothetical protein